MVTILVAYDSGRVIGFENKIPWHLPEDLKLFKKRTMGHSIVLGRKTWESLPKKPLPGRFNFIVSKQIKIVDHENTWVYPTLESALEAAKEKPFQVDEELDPIEQSVFLIGGAQIYKHALEKGLVDKIIASEVHGLHGGDVYFPELDEDWSCKEVADYDKFNVLEYERN